MHLKNLIVLGTGATFFTVFKIHFWTECFWRWFIIRCVEPVFGDIDTLNLLFYVVDMDDPENQSCKEVRLTFARFCSARQESIFFTTNTYTITIRTECTEILGKMKNK